MRINKEKQQFEIEALENMLSHVISIIDPNGYVHNGKLKIIHKENYYRYYIRGLRHEWLTYKEANMYLIGFKSGYKAHLTETEYEKIILLKTMK